MIIIKKSEGQDTFKLDGKEAKQELKEDSNSSMLFKMMKLVLASLELILTEYRKDSFNQELFDSTIITRLEQFSFLSLASDYRNWKLSLLWRGSRDGFDAKTFHSRCDGVPKTVTVIKTTTGFIFGGYTSQSWSSPVFGEYKQDPDAFLFTFKNPHNRPLKLKVTEPNFAVYNAKSNGPTFGWWHDLYVCDNSNAHKLSYVWSMSYELPEKDNGYWLGGKFFYGDNYFKVDEIEVFQIDS